MLHVEYTCTFIVHVHWNTFASECKKSTGSKVKVSCRSDTTTITWPTDLLLPASTQQVPASVSDKLEAKLRNKHSLKVLVYNQLPP